MVVARRPRATPALRLGLQAMGKVALFLFLILKHLLPSPLASLVYPFVSLACEYA